MALLMADSFDFASNIIDLGSSQNAAASQIIWDTAANLKFGTGGLTRFGTGQSIASNVTGQSNVIILSKSWASNDTTVFMNVVSYYATNPLGIDGEGTGSGYGWILMDGIIGQCGIWFEHDGAIRIRHGNLISGTILAEYDGAFEAEQYNHYQIQITIGSSGSVAIRKNGNTGNDFSASSINTQVTGNAYCNHIELRATNGGANPVNAFIYFDDFMLFSSTGATPNTWTGDVRAIQIMANGDPASPVFQRSPPTFNIFSGKPLDNSFSSVVGQITMTKLSLFQYDTKPSLVSFIPQVTNPSIHIQCSYYADNGGSPGVRLGSVSSQIIGCTRNVAVGLTVAPTFTRVANVQYWMGIQVDTAITGYWPWNGFTGSPGGFLNATYSTGTMVDGFGSFVTGVDSFFGLSTIVETVNAAGSYILVQEQHEDGDTSFIYDSNIGDEDIFDLQDLTVTPSSIILVVGKQFCAKSDSGARSGAIQLKSGATEISGPSTVLSSSWGYLTSPQPLDPDTGLPWTQAGVNAMKVGPKVTA